MELNKSLQTLIERAWSLHDRINDEIHNNSAIILCKICSEHGCYCGIAETPFEERQRLIAITDSLKEVEDMLISLQRLQSRQRIDRHAALTLLEESRLFLIEKVTQHQGRALDVTKELNACFGNGKTAFNWNSKEALVKKDELAVHDRKKRISRFLICWFGILFKPWKWQKAAEIAVKLIMVSASISSTIHFYRTRQQYRSSRTKNLSFVNSTKAGKHDFLLTISNCPLNVLHGKG